MPERLTPADLDDEQRAVYDGIASGPRVSGSFRIIEEDGSLTGPFFPMLFAPTVGGALAALGEAIRYDSSLSPRTREIAILAVAALRRSDYEWTPTSGSGRRSACRHRSSPT